MSIAVETRLNRTVVASFTAADILLSHVAVDVRVDPASEIFIDGFEAGYGLGDADQTQFIAGNLIMFQDPTFDINTGSLFYAGVNPPMSLGDVLYFSQITSVNDLYISRDFSAPLKIRGDHRLVVLLGRPQLTGAMAGTGGFNLTLRGSIEPLQGGNPYRDFRFR